MADCFMLMDQIPGETQDPDFPNAINVSGWEWGVNSRGEMATNAPRKGSADVRHFTFYHGIDSATAGLLSRCATNILIPNATLTQRRAGGSKAQSFLEIKFKEVRIVDVSLSTTNTQADYPKASISFSFETVSFDYTPQSKSGSDKSGRHNFTWIAGAKQ